jgi:methylamine dehydrogenase accessory protein MauD
MSGPWLISYVVLWGIVLFQGVVIFVLLRQLGLMYLGTAQGVARDGIAAGERAPEFTVSGLDGAHVSLERLRGLPALLVFASPSCVPCRGLIPDLNAFAHEHGDELRVLFLCRGSLDEARRFSDELHVQVPVAAHPDETLPDSFKARVTPFAFLLDGEGVVRAKGLANNRSHLDMLLEQARKENDRAAGEASRNGAAAEEKTPRRA